MTIRDLSLPQEEYCDGCFFHETGGCNVMLGPDEDVCLDRLDVTADMMDDDPGLPEIDEWPKHRNPQDNY